MTIEEIASQVQELVEWYNYQLLRKWLRITDPSSVYKAFYLDLESACKRRLGKRPWEEISEEEVKEYFKKILTKIPSPKKRLKINGKLFNPDEEEGINKELRKIGNYFYHYDEEFKCLLLAEIISEEKHYGYSVYILGKEFVRSLNHTVAKTINPIKTIFGRTCKVEEELWDLVAINKPPEKLTETKQKLLDIIKNKEGLVQILEHALPSDLNEANSKELAIEFLKPYLYHEFGHVIVQDKVIPLPLEEIVWMGIDLHPKEWNRDSVKRVKDILEILADTVEGGRLSYIISRKNIKWLGMFFLRQSYLPRGFDRLVEYKFTKIRKKYPNVDWEEVDEIRKEIFKKAKKEFDDIAMEVITDIFTEPLKKKR